MELLRITVFFIGCFAAFAAPAPSDKQASTQEIEELFRMQMNRSSEIAHKMRCRQTFRKVDVQTLLLETGRFKIVSEGYFSPKTLFVPTCSDSCTHCKMSGGRRQRCVATREKMQTFHIQYGLKGRNYYAHKEKVAKKCKCQPV